MSKYRTSEVKLVVISPSSCDEMVLLVDAVYMSMHELACRFIMNLRG